MANAKANVLAGRQNTVGLQLLPRPCPMPMCCPNPAGSGIHYGTHLQLSKLVGAAMELCSGSAPSRAHCSSQWRRAERRRQGPALPSTSLADTAEAYDTICSGSALLRLTRLAQLPPGWPGPL